jgi:hypothetical protein
VFSGRFSEVSKINFITKFDKCRSLKNVELITIWHKATSKEKKYLKEIMFLKFFDIGKITPAGELKKSLLG